MFDSKKWKAENPEKVRIYDKKYYEKKKNDKNFWEKRYKYKKEWRKKNPEKEKKQNKRHYQKYKERIKKDAKEQRNSLEGKLYRSLYRKKKRKEDPKYRLEENVKCLIWYSLKKKKAGIKWEKLVGYNIYDLMKRLESLFDNKMNWENYGSYWWIDHIKPRSLFNYIFPEDKEFQECWALENLQPLEKIANIKKSNFYFRVNTKQNL